MINSNDAWHVVVTKENIELLCKWRFGHLNYINDMSSKIIGWYKGRSKEHNPRDSREGFGIEITTEQFRKYILKEKSKLIAIW